MNNKSARLYNHYVENLLKKLTRTIGFRYQILSCGPHTTEKTLTSFNKYKHTDSVA